MILDRTTRAAAGDAAGAVHGIAAREPEPRLILRGVWKRYGGTPAVRGVDLAVSPGSFLTILGPSGSGKTTLLRIIAGFTAPDRGRVLIDGRDVTPLPPAARSVGMVFQNYALFPHMTAAENVEYGLKMRGWRPGDRRARVAEMLHLVGLPDRGRNLPRELSGGQQQRIALARALAFRPKLLLLDEPLGALDRGLRMRMATELRRIQREVHVSAVYVTHDREEALMVSDRIAILRDGAVEALGSPQALYSRPDTRFVATFFGGHNILRAPVARALDANRAVVRLLGREVAVATVHPLTPPCETWLSIPERAFSLTPQRPTSVPFALQVLDVLYLGDVMRATVQLDRETRMSAVFPAAAGGAPGAGAGVTAYLDPDLVVAVPAERNPGG